MLPWNKLPKNLRRAILGMIVLCGSAEATGCCRPFVCDPAPPPSLTPTRLRTPLIFDPPPPPSSTPTRLGRPSPMICDPTPPPSRSATPAVRPSPMICDPPPPPSAGPTVASVRSSTPRIFDPPPPPRETQAVQRIMAPRPGQVATDATQAGVAVKGKLVDTREQPLVGVLVTAEGSGQRVEGRTDSRGDYHLSLREPGLVSLVAANDRTHVLKLELKLHDVATVDWVQIGPISTSMLPLAEIRTVKIVLDEQGLFGAESPWSGAELRWTASGGTLAPQGEKVVWEPPTQPGRYLLQVVADWGPAALAVDAVRIEVDEDGEIAFV